MHVCVSLILSSLSLYMSVLPSQLIGGPPNPDHDSDENVVSVFINQVINPEKPLASAVSDNYQKP